MLTPQQEYALVLSKNPDDPLFCFHSHCETVDTWECEDCPMASENEYSAEAFIAKYGPDAREPKLLDLLNQIDVLLHEARKLAEEMK
jgi:hypothetical protein